MQPLTGGLRNGNFKVQLDQPPRSIVLRIYEHDVSLCRKEVDLLARIGRSVPVPEVLHAEAEGWEGLPPFALLRYIEGVSFHELERREGREALAQASHCVGQTLALIGRTKFPASGWIGPGPKVSAPLLEGPHPSPRFVDLCLASSNLQQRMPADLRDQTRAAMWSHAPQWTALDNGVSLVHGDFGRRNLLMRRVAGVWTVAAVLDWEFAVSGSPLIDLGHFLRYECASRPVAEPHFSQGYLQAGGTLPEGWRRLARLVDLIALCESLTHEALADTAVAELRELVRSTVDDRDPQFT
ncbi:MAG TPA: phosphotransferase [Steroidobacteraceae bacterium]|nr:phosphotransferase [Steroidobacteraceae bacterium]